MTAAAAVACLLVPIPTPNFIPKTRAGRGECCCDCVLFSEVIFLTAVFVWVAYSGLTSCNWKPRFLRTTYEFTMSFVVFKLSLHSVWYPMETFISSKLPELLGGYLPGECPFAEFLCPGSRVVFEALVYLVAAALLVTVLYACGVFSYRVRPRRVHFAPNER